MNANLTYLKKKKLVLGIVLIFCLSIIITRWLNIPMDNPMYDPRSGIYGDVWSDLNVKSAATFFRDHGYGETAALPVFNYSGKGTEGNSFVYTHYPPLPDELAGIMATITGSVDTRVLSILPLCVSLVFFGVIFLSLQAYNTENRLEALLAGILTVISCYYVCWADDIHQHVYGEFCKWLFVYLLYLYYTRPEKKRGLLIALCFLAFINTWITFEHILYYGIVVAGFSLIFERKLFTKVNVLLMLMPVLGLGLHVLQNYIYFGSWERVVQDITGAYTERTVGRETDSVRIGPEQWAEIPSKIEERINRMFFLGTVPTVGLSILGFIKLWKDHRKLFWVGVVLFLASASWIFFMTQHMFIHYFTIRHFGLAYAFMVSWGIAALFQYFRMAKARKWYWAMALCVIAGLLCFIPSIEYHFYHVYAKYAYMFPHLGDKTHYW